VAKKAKKTIHPGSSLGFEKTQLSREDQRKIIRHHSSKSFA